MRRILFIPVLLLFLCVSKFGMAFDNHRRGFIIGGGGGISYNVFHYVDDDIETDDESISSTLYHLDFRIGSGENNDKLMAYYWLRPYMPPIYIIQMFGVSFYLKQHAPSLYFNAGAGIAGIIIVGPGFIGGIGYEFGPHWSMELGIIYVGPKVISPLYLFGDTSAVYDLSSLAIRLSLIGIAY
jgi:hypothetical protein